MKKHIKILSLFLSILIFMSSIYYFSFMSFAKTNYEPGSDESIFGAKDWDDLTVTDKVGFVVTYVCSQVKAVTGGDFVSFLDNHTGFAEYRNSIEENDGEYVKVLDGGFTISKDLVDFIKQALKEYAEETNGYIIVPSVHFSTLSTSTFNTSYQYQTVKALVNEYGLVGIQTYSNGGITVRDFSEYLNNNAGFYIYDSYPDYYYLRYENYLTWARIYYANHSVGMRASCEKVIHSWEEAKSSAPSTEGLEYYPNSDSFDRYSLYDEIHLSKQGNFQNGSYLELISKDGRNILVFKSNEALESYSVGHRTVYFGSKFYEDTGTVTGSYDDLQDWLDGKYDDFFDRLEDLIPEGSNLSEDELEKLIDRLLDQLNEIGDKVDEGNKETNNLLQQILNALNKLDSTMASAFSGIGFDTSGIEAYLARILADLDYIVYEMEEKTEEEISDDLDNMSDTVMDSFSDIGELAKTKFPLSIPWDIYSLLTKLGGGPPAPASDVLPASAPYDASSSGFVSISTYSLNETIPLSDEHGGGGSDHGTGNEDGGGGHSRGGYYLSADGDPVFVLPLIFSESMGLGGTINIDMSQFRVLSDISRTLFTLIFAINLVHLTFKAVGLGKDVLE